MRCFAAVDLDDSLKNKIKILQERIADYDVKLVEPQNLHFTLKFLGETDELTIGKVRERLGQVATNFHPFNATIKEVGVFPNMNYIRVIWLGCKDMLNLQNAVNEALSDMFKKEKPSPHLTIARVRSGRYRNQIAEFASQHKDMEIGAMRVDKIKLKKSTLTRQGPVYEDIGAIGL